MTAGQPRGAGGCDEPRATPCPTEGRLLLALTGSSHTVPRVKPRREDEGQHDRNTKSLLAVSFPLQALTFLPAAAFSSRCAVPTGFALSARPQHPEPGRGQAAPGAAEGNGGSTDEQRMLLPLSLFWVFPAEASAALTALTSPSEHYSKPN